METESATFDSQGQHGLQHKHPSNASPSQRNDFHITDTTSKKIPRPRVYLAGTEALVWDVQDIRYLRQTCRILGSLSGSLPRSPMQNIFQGLPLRLMPEEVHALRNNAIVDIVDENRSYNRSPDADHVSQTSPASTDYISLRTLSTQLPYYSPILQADSSAPRDVSSTREHHSHTDPSVTRALQLWNYPVTDKQRQQCAVFMQLWEAERFFVAPGMKFGGDYLLYKSDPLICHASLVATIVDADEPLSLADLACSARLASTVQKQHLICSLAKRQSLHHPSLTTPGVTSFKEEPTSRNSVLMFAIGWAGF
ncbi:hypothetical protein EDD21DRAFT_10842 [Dissophora ornata]|nr:hypothetical protein EDD21DRAFT_10842 [Dissophora ornata]